MSTNPDDGAQLLAGETPTPSTIVNSASSMDHSRAASSPITTTGTTIITIGAINNNPTTTTTSTGQGVRSQVLNSFGEFRRRIIRNLARTFLVGWIIVMPIFLLVLYGLQHLLGFTATAANDIDRRLCPAARDSIKVIVGGQTFVERIEILQKHARYFKLSLRSSGWVEYRNGIVELPGFSVLSFKMLKSWIEVQAVDWSLCSGSWFTGTSLRKVMVKVGNKERIGIAFLTAELDALVDCYILGDYLDAPDFQNEIMNQLIALYRKIYLDNNNSILLHNIHHIWNNSSDGSPLLRVMLDSLTCLSPKTLQYAFAKGLIPYDLAPVLAAYLLNRLEPTLPWDDWEIRYHIVPRGGQRSSPASDVFSFTPFITSPSPNWDRITDHAGDW